MLKIPDFSRTKIFVMGDVMLDRYLFGSTDRVSPEAPVPIVSISKTEERPGGAANVAVNLSRLGVQTTIFGVVGDDEDANILENILIEENIECVLKRAEDLNTTIKTRVQSHGQQILRFDKDSFIKKENLPDQNFESILSETDAIIISDYAKGVTSDIDSVIKICRDKGIFILVDPKGLDYEKYRGADILTPNQIEFEAIAGRCESDEILVEKALGMIEDLALRAILITRSHHGMLLVTSEGKSSFLDANARDVFDVTGAGDTVIAVFAAASAAGAKLLDAAKLANYAAGIVVGKIGVASIDIKQLSNEMLQDR